ncbi:MAG: hypothetical protein ACLVKO_03455 [Dysgonomonas sp.]
MKSDSLSKLEKNVSFKKKHLPKYFWLKNGSVYLPFLVLFFALFGLVYLLNYDMLLTVRAIPFALLFVIGAIWLKVAKRGRNEKIASE